MATSVKEIVHDALQGKTRKILFTAAAAVLAYLIMLVSGCTNCLMVDVSQGDIFSYSYSPWENRSVEEASARLRYWCYEGPKHYDTNRTIRLDMALYIDGTNCIKDAHYLLPCTAEKLN